MTESRIAIATACLAALCSLGCESDRQLLVIDRVADLIAEAAGNEPPAPYSTALHKRLNLAGHTRTVLGDPASPGDGLVKVHGNVELDLPTGAVLEIAYGLRPTPAAAGNIRFSIAARNSERSDLIWEGMLEIEPTSTDRWFRETVPLTGWTGKTSLEFVTQMGDFADIAVGPELGVFAAPTVLALGPRPERPNVIVISLDTLRARSLGLYGYDRDTSPFIDDYFSNRAIVVDTAYTQASETLWGHTAMFSGVAPSFALAPGGNDAPKRTPTLPTLAEAFRAAGYRTASFNENGMLAAEWGFARGFELYAEEKKQVFGRYGTGFARRTFVRGLEWIDSLGDQPFFLFLQTYQVHSPYTPPAEYASLFPTADDATAQEVDRDLYDREIRYTDDLVRELFTQLERRGILDNAVVLLTSDHGEEFGEHGGRLHGVQLYEEVLRVPFLISAPGLLPAGVRRSGPALLTDIVPTLLDLAGIEAPQQVDGISLVAHLKDGEALPARSFVAEARAKLRWTYDGTDDDWQPPSFAVVDLPWKLVRSRTRDGFAYELYDLARDPSERNNVFGKPDTPSDRLRKTVDSYESDSARRVRESVATWSGAQRWLANRPEPELDDERLEKLRTLGYIE